MPSWKQRPGEQQSEKFKAMARELGADEGETRWDEWLKKVAKGKPE